MSADETKGIAAEVEAKLLAPAASTLRAVARLREIEGYKLVPQPAVRLHTLYLDTPDLSLARQGIALRLRRCGRRWEATIKWEGSREGEVYERPELTVSLRGRPRPPFEIKHPQLQEFLAARVAGRQLEVALVTDIRRSRLHVVGRDDRRPLAEICLDRVGLDAERAGGPQARYFEVEIEKLDGDCGVVRLIAGRLRQAFGLVPSAETKMARGLALLGKHLLLPPPGVGLTAEDSVDSAARKVVWQQLSALREQDAGVRCGADPEALHDMRVATRRLRAALAMFREAFSPSDWSWLRGELRWLRQNLGSVRDMDVQLQRLAGFGASTPAALRDALATYARFLERRRARRRKEMLAALSSPRYFALLVRLESYATSPVGERHGKAFRPLGELAAHEIEKAYRRVCKRGEKVEAEPTPEGLHGLRIRAKRLRYALELCRDLTGREGAKVIRRLVRVQDLLGSFHDAVVAADFVRQYVEGPGRRAGAPALITLGAFLAHQLHRADEMRLDFARTWKRFARRRTRREIETVLRRLGKEKPTLEPTPTLQDEDRGERREAGGESNSRCGAIDPPDQPRGLQPEEAYRQAEDRRPLARHPLRAQEGLAGRRRGK